MTTLSNALADASRYWNQNERTSSGCRGGGQMPLRAARCVSLLGGSCRKLSTLGPRDGAQLLVSLSKAGLSRASVQSYYGAALRMLNLAGVSTLAWPKPPTPPRKVRQGVPPDKVDALIEGLRARGWDDTADWAALMRDTGMRAEVEALRGQWHKAGSRIEVTSGKGGHARVIPYRGQEDGPIGGLTYEGHLRRWKLVAEEIGAGDLRPHDLRRGFAARVYHNSGKDLRVTQALLGHADIATTAGYIGVDEEALINAIG